MTAKRRKLLEESLAASAIICQPSRVMPHELFFQRTKRGFGVISCSKQTNTRDYESVKQGIFAYCMVFSTEMAVTSQKTKRGHSSSHFFGETYNWACTQFNGEEQECCRRRWLKWQEEILWTIIRGSTIANQAHRRYYLNQCLFLYATNEWCWLLLWQVFLNRVYMRNGKEW